MAVAVHPWLGDQVDVGIDAAVAGIGIADLEHRGGFRRFIDQVVPVGIAGLESGAIARTQRLLAAVADEAKLAFNHPNELILVAVPVALARPAAGRDHGQVDAEEREALRSAQTLTGLATARLVV